MVVCTSISYCSCLTYYKKCQSVMILVYLGMINKHKYLFHLCNIRRPWWVCQESQPKKSLPDCRKYGGEKPRSELKKRRNNLPRLNSSSSRSSGSRSSSRLQRQKAGRRQSSLIRGSSHHSAETIMSVQTTLSFSKCAISENL